MAKFSRQPEFEPFPAAAFSLRRTARVIIVAACGLGAVLGGLAVVWFVRRCRLQAFCG